MIVHVFDEENRLFYDLERNFVSRLKIVARSLAYQSLASEVQILHHTDII